MDETMKRVSLQEDKLCRKQKVENIIPRVSKLFRELVGNED